MKWQAPQKTSQSSGQLLAWDHGVLLDQLVEWQTWPYCGWRSWPSRRHVPNGGSEDAQGVSFRGGHDGVGPDGELEGGDHAVNLYRLSGGMEDQEFFLEGTNTEI